MILNAARFLSPVHRASCRLATRRPYAAAESRISLRRLRTLAQLATAELAAALMRAISHRVAQRMRANQGKPKLHSQLTQAMNEEINDFAAAAARRLRRFLYIKGRSAFFNVRSTKLDMLCRIPLIL